MFTDSFFTKDVEADIIKHLFYIVYQHSGHYILVPPMGILKGWVLTRYSDVFTEQVANHYINAINNILVIRGFIQQADVFCAVDGHHGGTESESYDLVPDYRDVGFSEFLKEVYNKDFPLVDY